jgi:hypothetical protein
MDKSLLSQIVTVAPLVGAGAAILAAIKNAADISHLSRAKSREEYKFAKEFFSDCQDASKKVHPFLKEKGLLAIGGDADIAVSDVEHLLRLKDSPRALKCFAAGREFLNPISDGGDKRISFKSRYRWKWVRGVIKSWYLIWYFMFCMCAAFPLLAPLLSKKINTSWEAAALTLILFLPLAFLALKAGVKISQAEWLVANQEFDPEVVSFESQKTSPKKTRLVKAAWRPRGLR